MKAGAVVFQSGQRLVRWALAASFFGFVTLACGLWTDPRRAFFSYLAAYAFFTSITVGTLFFLMICHTMSAVWPVALRRLLETVCGTIVLLAALFIPICFGLDSLYTWAAPERIVDVHARHLIEHKAPYLNVPFFLIRSVFYFAVWITAALLLRKWSIETDRTPDGGRKAPSGPRRSRVLSGALLPLVGLTFMFAAFDWLMSLDPLWFSTMYGVYYAAGGFLGALALLTVFTFVMQRGGFLPGLELSHYYALGRLLLTGTIFWGYTAYFQYFLIWLANKPDEVTFYLARSGHDLNLFSGILVFGHFAAFLALLSYGLKWHPARLTAVAVWLLVFRYIDVYWLVLPALHPETLVLHWLDAGALLATGGAWVAFGVWLLRGLAAVPVHDPALDAAMQYKSS